MGRRQRIEPSEDGSANLRVRFPPALYSVIERYADVAQLATEDAARLLLLQIDALVSGGEVAWLSADWRKLASASRGLEAEPSFIGDLAKLHRSDRVKSGYFGVYANGQGFRAIGRRGAVIGTFKSADEAAWKRYVFYKTRGWPYGELEVSIDDLRKSGQGGDEATLRRLVLETARDTGTLHFYADHMTQDEIELYGTGAADTSEGGLQMAGFTDGGLDAANAALEKLDGARETRPQGGRLLTKPKEQP